MLPRSFISPKGHWLADPNMPISQGVRCGQLLVLAGQVALDADGQMQAPGDLERQTRITMDYVGAVLGAAGLDMADLVQLRVFYVSRGEIDEDDLAALIAERIGKLDGPGPVLTMVPLEALGFPGMVVEIEGIAMRDENGRLLARTAAWDPEALRLPPPFVHALRVGEMIFTSGITARGRSGKIAAKGNLLEQCRIVLPRLDGLLRQLGADLQDAVKTNLFNAEPGTKGDWREPALARAGHYREPGPCATGLALRRLWPEGMMIKNDIVAMRGLDGARLPRRHVWPRGHWDWTVHLPYRHALQCGDLMFCGGQVPLSPKAEVLHKGDLVAQTRTAMDYIERLLGELGLGFENVLRVNSFYVGEASRETLMQNANARFERFRKPGPASAGVPVPYLAYPDMLTEIDIIAMA